MPNRILKESICTSESIDRLKPKEEIFFYRLIVNCDDFGRMDARAKILKAKLFPLREEMTLKSIEDGLRALATVGLVVLYEVGGKPFLQLPTWEAHQQMRAQKSKYPAPDTSCNQLISDDIRCPRNPIQSESESESETESILPGAKAPDSIIGLTLNDKTEYFVSQGQVDEWAELFPAVDIVQELRHMRAWLDSNPTKRKTKSGILRFITGWLGKTQDKGGSKRASSKSKSFEEIVNERLGQ